MTFVLSSKESSELYDIYSGAISYHFSQKWNYLTWKLIDPSNILIFSLLRKPFIVEKGFCHIAASYKIAIIFRIKMHWTFLMNATEKCGNLSNIQLVVSILFYAISFISLWSLDMKAMAKYVNPLRRISQVKKTIAMDEPG